MADGLWKLFRTWRSSCLQGFARLLKSTNATPLLAMAALQAPSLLDAWFYPMVIRQPLPTLPIWLTPELHVTLPLETSYEETCGVLGIA